MHGVLCMCDLCEEAVNQQKSSMNLHLLATLQHRHILLLLLCLSRLNPLHLSSSVHPTQEKNYKDRVCSLYTQTLLIESYIHTSAKEHFFVIKLNTRSGLQIEIEHISILGPSTFEVHDPKKEVHLYFKHSMRRN